MPVSTGAMDTLWSVVSIAFVYGLQFVINFLYHILS